MCRSLAYTLMVGLIDGFRWSILGCNTPLDQKPEFRLPSQSLRGLSVAWSVVLRM